MIGSRVHSGRNSHAPISRARRWLAAGAVGLVALGVVPAPLEPSKLVELSALDALGPRTVEAGGEDLLVPVSVVRSAKGRVFVALYNQSGWLRAGRFIDYREVRAKQGSVTAVFRGVPAGRYSVAVFHDENANGRVDTNWLGLPAEGFGFSRITPFRVPSFGETSFELNHGATQPVRLRY